MDLNKLEYFVSLAREGGFAKAARSLGISQPTLSRAIAALEKDLGQALFDRSHAGTKLMDSGKKFLPHAVVIIQEAERARTEFVPELANETDRARIGISPNMLFDVVPGIVQRLIEQYAHAKFTLTTGTQEFLLESLRQRELDLVVCADANFVSDRKDSHLLAEVLGDETIVPVACKDHEIFSNKITLEILTQERWAIPYQMSLSYRFENVFYKRNLRIPEQTLNTSSLSLIYNAVNKWNLLGMLPKRLLGMAAIKNDLRVIEIPELYIDFKTTLFRNKSGSLPVIAGKLAEQIRTLSGEDASFSLIR